MISFCYTRDMEATSEFYSGTLQLPLVLEQAGCRIYRVAGDAYIGFCTKVEKQTDSNDDVTLTLVTDDVDRWFERVENAGYQVIKPPAATPQYNIYNCFVKDPSGYTVEIQRFEDPRWPPEK